MTTKKVTDLELEIQELTQEEKEELKKFIDANLKHGTVRILKEAQDQGRLAKPNGNVCPTCHGTGRV